MKTILLILILLATSIVLNAQTTPLHPSDIAKGTYYGLSRPLRDIPAMTPAEFRAMARKARENGEFNEGLGVRSYPYAATALPRGNDAVWQKAMGDNSKSAKLPTVNFEGQTSPYFPPDCNGAVGPNHYMQTINTTYAIYDKAGVKLAGPTALNLLFGSVPGANRNDGDPVILYDEQADRWLVTEFSIPNSGQNYMLMAVSSTNDPTGTWHQYSFPVASMPDYPKFGIWSDGYYMGDNNSSGNDIYVFQREQMLIGGTAQVIGFNNAYRPSSVDGFMCVPPVDNDGPFAPAGSPGLFIAFNDDAFGGGSDELWIYELAVNWTTPASSTFNRTQQLAVAPFDSNFGNNWDNITQPGTSQKVDAIPQVIMNTPQYRNFGTHQTLVCCHTVDVDNTNHAGIRWYELEKTTGAWTVRQQSTYAPDAANRWMGSIAMNAGGNIGLGYSVSSSTIYPSIRYCGQTAAANVLANSTLDYPEESIFEGANSQTGANRWGDYSKISLDPLDDGTFWYTTQYIGSGGSRKTKVAAFSIGIVAPVVQFASSNTKPCLNTSVAFADESTGSPFAWAWSVTPSTYTYIDGTDSTSQNPHVQFTAYGNYTVSLTATNGGGSITLTKSGYVSVNAVNDDFSVNATTVVVGNSVVFADESSCNVGSWAWNFGDGALPATSTTSGPQVVTYNTTGLKTVSLTLNDTVVQTKTDYINVIDPGFNMSSETLSVCSGDFFDPGGASANYGNNLDYTMVLVPGTPGNSLQVIFNTFNLEPQMFCANDYLRILNGNNTLSPVIGNYCGSNSPDTVTANNPTGSLTFVFHSNNIINFPGWSATISCIEGVANPLSFSANAVSSAQINLAWTQNSGDNPVMVAWSPDGIFGNPVNGTSYAAGDNLPGGGTVLYAGTATSYSHTLLNPETLYQYKAFSQNTALSWSFGITSSATTLALPSLNITPAVQTVTEPAGSTSFDVISNASWTASSDAAWCVATPAGFGNGVITATYEQNSGPVIRTANIGVNVTGLPEQVLQVIQLPSFVSISENPSNTIQLFPNPNSGLFTISSASSSSLDMNLTILDASGKTVLSKQYSGAAKYSFDLSGSPAGSYYVKLDTGSKSIVWKLLIKK